jgi:Ca-activated chloride channel family protein
MGFENPLLGLLGAIVTGAVIFILRFKKNHFALDIPLGPPGGSVFKPPIGVETLVALLQWLERVGLVCLLIALAGPVSIRPETLWMDRGADVLFVLDISPSMSALDMGGRSRFDVATTLIRDFANQRNADGIGLVAVAADSALLVPPTIDRTVLLDRLDSLKIGELGDGTALGTGIALGALHIGSSGAPKRAVVLITDGENNAGAVNPTTAAAILRTLGVSLWVIGVGTAGEVPIDYLDPETHIRRTGMLDSRFNADTLESIAQAGGGTYLSAPTAQALEAAFSKINTQEASFSRSRTVYHTTALHTPFVILALVLLGGGRFFRRQILGAFV